MYENTNLSEFGQQVDDCSEIVRVLKAKELFEDLPRTDRGFVLISLILTVATVFIYAETVRFIVSIYGYNSLDRHRTMWIVSVMPIISVFSATALVVPRMTMITELVFTVAIAMGFFNFWMEVQDHGDELDFLVARLKEATVSLGSPPLCCFKCCCPRVKWVKTTVTVAIFCFMQAIVTQPVFCFLGFLLYKENLFDRGLKEYTKSFIFFASGNVLTTLVGVYGLSLLSQVAVYIQRPLDVTAKRLSLQASLMAVNIQGTLFGILEIYGFPPCTGRISTQVRGNGIYFMLLIAEMFVVSILARCLYHKNADTIKTLKSSLVTSEASQNQSTISLDLSMPEDNADPHNADPQTDKFPKDTSDKKSQKDKLISDISAKETSNKYGTINNLQHDKKEIADDGTTIKKNFLQQN